MATTGKGDDARPEQLMAQMDLLQREMARMDRRLAALERALVEAQQAAATVQALSEETGEVDAFLPIGGGVLVRARIDPGAPVLLPIGADYATESAPAQVADALRARVEAISKQFSEANVEAERIAQAAAALNEALGATQPE